MKDGIYVDLPAPEYHADATALSASSAKVLLGKRPPSPAGDALRFGTLVHTVILEPDKIDTYAVLDPHIIGVKIDGTPSDNPTATKAWKDAVFKAKCDGLTIISPETLAHAQAMAAAVMAHPEADRLLAAATHHEVSLYATHPTGAQVRGRFDLLGPDFIADVKTCRSADTGDFSRAIDSLMYHVSAANYVDLARANGLDIERFLFIAVEKEPTPGGDYRVNVMDLASDAIDQGRERMTEACQRWLDLGKRVDLPSYGTDINPVDLPGYVYADALDDLELEGIA